MIENDEAAVFTWTGMPPTQTGGGAGITGQSVANTPLPGSDPSMFFVNMRSSLLSRTATRSDDTGASAPVSFYSPCMDRLIAEFDRALRAVAGVVQARAAHRPP